METASRMPAPHGADALDLTDPRPAAADPPMSVIAASFAVGSTALMILGVQPVLLEALVGAHRITEAQAGPLATIEDLALAVGAGVGPAWMRRGGIRGKAIVLSLLLAAVNLAVYAATSPLLLDVARGVAGLLEGLSLSAILVILIHHSQPDRVNGAFLALSTLPQAVMAAVVPLAVTPWLGPLGGFTVLAALSLISVGVALALPNRASGPTAESPARTLWTPAILTSLAAVALQNAGIGGAWTYLPLIVDQRHFAPILSGVAIGGGLILQVAGAAGAAAWGRRLPFGAVLIGGTLCQTGVIAALTLAGAPALYVGLALLFGLFWLALSPFQVRLLIALDPSRGSAVLLTALILVGLSLGPAVSAICVRGPDVTGAFVIAMLLMGSACALCTFAVLSMRGQRAAGSAV